MIRRACREGAKPSPAPAPAPRPAAAAPKGANPMASGLALAILFNPVVAGMLWVAAMRKLMKD